MARKKKDSFVPDDEDASTPFYKKLLGHRDDLAERKTLREDKASREIGEFGFWSAVAGVAFAADWALTGGVLTIVAGASGLEWMHHQNQANKAAKELKEIDEKLFKLEAERLQHQPSLELKSGLKEEFSRTQGAVDELRQQVKTIQTEVDKAKSPKHLAIEKPKFDPPKR